MLEKRSFDRREFLKVAGTVGVLSGSAETALAQQSDQKRNEILVGVAPSANARQTAKRALPSEARIVGENDTLGYVRAELPERVSAAATASVASTVASRPGVEYAEQNAVYETLTVPNDPRFGDQYAPQMVNAPEAWETTFGDADVTVAVVDQGIKADHPDLEASFGSDRGRDFADDDDDPSPDTLSGEHHGTHVAGIVAGRTDNAVGIAGISNATLLSVRALDESGSGYTSDVADGIQWAADNGADVINLSLGGGGDTETLSRAVAYAEGEGVLLVAAAGNGYGGPVSYPAAYDECLAVSALDPDGDLAAYSNTGPEVELAAPGTNVLSTWTDDGYETLSGTSMATPVVSGVAALVLSRRDYSPDELRTYLEDTAVDSGLASSEQGAGRVDAAEIGDPADTILSIHGTGPRADYTFSVTDNLQKSTANGASINDSDSISGQTATGHTTSGVDSYVFSGTLEAFSLDGKANVTLDGEPAHVEQLPDHVVTIAGTGPRADYTFTVADDLEKSTANGADRNDSDTISGQTATGHTTSGIDSYVFSGDLEAFSLDGKANVTLDGESAHVGQLPDHVVTIAGTGPRADYTFTVADDLEKSTANGADRNDSDSISGRTATGHTTSGKDSYTFSGTLEAFELEGEANVTIDGEPAHVDQLPEHVLTIAGTGPRADYTFSVTNDLQKSTANGADRNDSDTISGRTATGHTTSGKDSYVFSGTLEAFSLDGKANVTLDGEPAHVEQLPDHVVTIAGTGPRADYTFTVADNLQKSTANGASINDSDTISGRTATGHTTSGKDSYTFSGDLEAFSLDGKANVTLDGEPAHVEQLPDHVVTIAGTGPRADYTFTVADNLQKSTANGASINDSDTISGQTATGHTTSGIDSYVFSGELHDLQIDGDAIVYLNNEELNTVLPTIGIHNGLTDANFDTIDRMEEWQNTPYAVQNLFVPWNPDEGHMDWLFDRILPRIWNAGRTPLITWEPYTPGARTASVDTQSLVERNKYDAYIESLADTTPNDIEVRIGNGDYDSYIDRWAGRLREALAGSSGRRAYLRLAHEMNGDWYPWSPTVGDSSPQSYVEMWQRVHNRFDRQGVGDDLLWMWCVNAEDVGSYAAEGLYPGGRYVDWMSLDGYNWGRSEDWSRWESPDSIYGGMLDRLADLGTKPVCVAELASSSKVGVGYDPQRKDEWIRDAITYFENRNVDMWCWFNEDKETDWAVFDGAHGTETVANDGQQVNAYSAYRKALDAYATISGTTVESNATARAIDGD